MMSLWCDVMCCYAERSCRRYSINRMIIHHYSVVNRSLLIVTLGRTVRTGWSAAGQRQRQSKCGQQCRGGSAVVGGVQLYGVCGTFSAVCHQVGAVTF
jgi:hypothetical protein